MTDPFFMGAIVGPYANRVAHARCEIDGKETTLSANEGQHQLHGGNYALANQFWLCSHHDEKSLTLTCKLKDNFMATLEILTLRLFTKYYTPVDSSGIPIGEIKSVKGINYDFLSLKKISNSCESKILDDNFVIAFTDTTKEPTSFHHATLVSADQKLSLHAYSNYPAIQVYTGQYLKEPFFPNQGVCLEPQFTPDSPNQKIRPFHFTTSNQPLSTVIIYKLTK